MKKKLSQALNFIVCAEITKKTTTTTTIQTFNSVAQKSGNCGTELSLNKFFVYKT